MSVPLDWRERTASPDYRAAFSPGKNIMRRRFRPLGRIRQWKDDRPADSVSHRAHSRFMESVRLARRADEYCRMRIDDNVAEADAIGRCQRPMRQIGAPLHEWRLKRLQSGHALDQQAVAIDQIEAVTRLRLGQARSGHGAQ